MRIGIGLPNPVPGTSGTHIVEWARRAEERGFSALTTIDRIVYPSFDCLVTLGAAAGATSRIELMTNILLAPVYQPVLLAKSTASLDQLSGGRLTLGLSAGGRADDFAATGRNFHTRGRDLDEAVALMHRAWRGEPMEGTDKPLCPAPVRGAIPILFGGTSDHTIRRIVEWGNGWAAGGGGPDMVAPFAETVRSAWQSAGRSGEPRLTALVYYSLGEDADADSRAYLRDYYAFLGQWADAIAEGAVRSEATVRNTVRAFEDAGFTDVLMDPTTSSLDQVDRLADLLL